MAQEVTLIDPLDGSGNGKARVKNGKLQSQTISVSGIENASKDGQVYNVIGAHTIALAATQENVIYFKNISKTENVYINKCVFNSSLIDTQFKVYMNPSFTSGGVAVVPVNMLSSVIADDSETQVLDNSLSDLVTVNTKNILPVSVDGKQYVHNFNDSLVIAPNGSFSIDAIHATLVPAVSVSILFRVDQANSDI